MSEIQFDPEVYLIEDDIINYFLSSPMFTARDPLFIKILLLFMTRKYLTQATLQNITHMSAGKICEEVNRLLELGFIEISDKSKKGKITYVAKDAGLVLLQFTRNTINQLVKWQDELAETMNELESNASKLSDLNGFKRLYENYRFYLELISNYERALDLLDSTIKSSKIKLK